MKIEVVRRLSLAVPMVAIILSFQNCGLYVEPDPEASTFQKAEECMSSEVDACVFDKNAVAQAGKAVTLDRIGGYQSVGVTLIGRDASGNLKNADFEVTTTWTPRLTASEGFRHYFHPSKSALEQVMAYVAAQRARAWMQSAGVFPASAAGVKIVADSSFNGYLPAQNEIHLERTGRTFPAALDQSLTVHLYAQSVVDAATTGESHTGLATKSVTCDDTRGMRVPNGCCSTANGCGPAIVSGIGDYMVAAVFGPGRSRLGEGWKNDPAGLRICGYPRDPAALLDVRVSEMNAACATAGASANGVAAMGALYASSWWAVRASGNYAPASVDRLFLRHLASIKGDDDFATLQAKIVSAATTDEEEDIALAVITNLQSR